MHIIGVTGGIGSGKTALLGRLEKSHKCKVISADETAHLLCEPGRACFPALLALLGERILGADGRIDRGQMAQIVFGDDELLEQVNAIIHPEVYAHIQDLIHTEEKKGELDYIFIEAALLIESGYDKIVDETWYVHTDAKKRMGRLNRTRNVSQDKAQRIMDRQLSEADFRARCDVVIDNNADLDSAVSQACKVIENCTRYGENK